MKRRLLLQAIIATPLAAQLSLARAANTVANPVIEVYKTASCGCCTGWVDHVRAAGFIVNTHNVEDTVDIRARLGMPQALGSCHTASVQGYVLEGHVPASEIKRLLAERPKARGLAVPSMPMGAPGMEGHRIDPYDVLLVKADSSYTVYRHFGK